MKLEYFIAKRYIRQKTDSYIHPIIRIGMVTVILSTIVMVLASAITLGFKKDINDKVVGFAGDIQISRYNTSSIDEAQSIERHPDYLTKLSEFTFIKNVYPYANKAGLLKTENYNHGFVLKGVDSTYDFNFFSKHLIEGRLPDYKQPATSNEILVSKAMAQLLELQLGDKVRAFFMDKQSTRARAFEICGIYESGFGDLDKQFIIGDLRHVQRLNNWTTNEIEGLEIITNEHNFQKNYTYAQRINEIIPIEEVAMPVTERYAEIYQWLNLIDTNVWVILSILAVVIAISLASVFLIMIIERTNQIGLFKAIGMRQKSIREIFSINVLYIAGVGLIIGDVIALLICWLQSQFQIFTLDSNFYHMSYVPIFINFPTILIINIGTFLVSFLAMFLPSLAIGRIKAAVAVKL